MASTPMYMYAAPHPVGLIFESVIDTSVLPIGISAMRIVHDRSNGAHKFRHRVYFVFKFTIVRTSKGDTSL